MRLLILIVLIFLLQASSCNREEPVIKKDVEGIITSKPATKLATVTDNFSEKAVLGVANYVIYLRGAVLPGMHKGQRTLKMIDIDTGDELWEWNDPIGNRKFDATKYYVYDNYFVFDEGRELYCVDLATGNTVWKKRYDASDSPLLKEVNGIGNDFYIIAGFPYASSKANPQSVRVYKTSVFNGPTLEEVLQITPGNFVTNNGIATYGWEIAVFKNTVGDTLIFTDTFDTITETTHSQTQLSLYNLAQQKWVYEKKPLSGIYSGSVAKPKLHNGIVYMAMSPFIVAVDLMSGEEVWRWNKERAGYGTSGFILVPEKNLIVFNAETSSTTLFALDLTTGAQVWSEPSSGTSSHLQYLNGVVYWVGGGDGWLHAVDVDTGKHLWKIVSPDEAINSNAWFTRYCAVFPGEDGEKGKVVVSSGLHAFAYEAAR